MVPQVQNPSGHVLSCIAEACLPDNEMADGRKGNDQVIYTAEENLLEDSASTTSDSFVCVPQRSVLSRNRGSEWKGRKGAGGGTGGGGAPPPATNSAQLTMNTGEW